MRYQNVKLREMLAAEYVLGTLHGAARRRFTRLLLQDAALRRVTEDWQRRLNPLAENLPPIVPPKRVWRAIQAQLSLLAPRRAGWWRSVEFWRPAALAAGLMAAALGVYLFTQPVRLATPDYMAVLSDNQAQASWVISLTRETRRLTVQAARVAPPGAEQSLELWALPASGAAPQSLGLLPADGRITLSLDRTRLQLLTRTKALAVSLEPAGGSPTGLPTGPVLYQGPWLAL
jgi:anti-sigma-K factor RskA